MWTLFLTYLVTKNTSKYSSPTDAHVNPGRHSYQNTVVERNGRPSPNTGRVLRGLPDPRGPRKTGVTILGRIDNTPTKCTYVCPKKGVRCLLL